MLKIGNISLENPLISAPLAGISDSVFRVFAKKFGCSLVCSEMLSSMALVYQNNKTRFMAGFSKTEKPISVQIAGWRADIMAEAASILSSQGADIIDINAGCSVRKVIKNREGAYLLKDFSRAREIIRSVVKAVKVPVTIKIRKTWCGDYNETLEFAKMAETEGVCALTVHGRTPEQQFSGKADWEIIKLIKEKLSIPVIGNGDINNARDAKNLMDMTGCDGVMVGRASLGNPWIFSQITNWLSGKEIPPAPSAEEKISFALDHYRLLIEHKGEETAFRQMRKFLGWYIKGLRGASRIREKICAIDDYKSVIDMMTEYRDTYNNETG